MIINSVNHVIWPGSQLATFLCYITSYEIRNQCNGMQFEVKLRRFQGEAGRIIYPSVLDTQISTIYIFSLFRWVKVHIISGIVNVNFPTNFQSRHHLFRRCYVLRWRNHYFSRLFSLSMKSSTCGVMELNLYHNRLRLFYFIIFCVTPSSLPHTP